MAHEPFLSTLWSGQIQGMLLVDQKSLSIFLAIGACEWQKPTLSVKAASPHWVVFSESCSLRRSSCELRLQGQTLGDSEEQGSLACYSPWGHKESDTTERLGSSQVEGAGTLESYSGRLAEAQCFWREWQSCAPGLWLGPCMAHREQLSKSCSKATWLALLTAGKRDALILVSL